MTGQPNKEDKDSVEDVNDSTEEEEMSIAHRVKSRKLSKLSPSISFNCHYSDSESVPDTIESALSDEITSLAPDETVIDTIISVVHRIAPDLRYSKAKADARRKRQLRKARKKLTRSMHPDLRCLWTHVDEVVTPKVKEVRVPPVSPLPSVDWTQVNKRFLSNLPESQSFPLHGCSQDPDFYVPVPVRKEYPFGTKITRFECHNPFGAEHGYLTDAGIIARGGHGEIVHGYVFSAEHNTWVLKTRDTNTNTNLPRDRGKKKPSRDEHKVVFQKKFKRRKV